MFFTPVYIVIKVQIRKMGNTIKLEAKTVSTEIFTGKIALYKGNIIPKKHWLEYKDMKGFKILTHFGVKSNMGHYVMYSFFTSKNNHFQGNGNNSLVENFKCSSGLFSHINYPICTKEVDFNEYVDCSTEKTDAPFYVQDAWSKGYDVRSDAFTHFKSAYANASFYNRVFIYDKIYVENTRNNVFIASSLGILNKHNSALFLKSEVRVADLSELNTSFHHSLV